MTKANQEFKTEATGAGIKLWQIADRVGYTDSHFSRLLRKEFTEELKERAYKALAELRAEQEGS